MSPAGITRCVRMVTVLLIPFLLLPCVSWAQAGAAGSTYYVSPGGDNANPGTRGKPWAAPGFGSRKLTPGDTLVILGGCYVLKVYDDDVVTPPSGKADAWITIRGEKGNRPVLAGGDDLLAGIDLSGASYVTLENLEITHDAEARGEALQFRDAIMIAERPSSHIVLRDLYIHHIDEFGLNFQDVDDLQVINCRIEYCGFGSIGGPARERGGWRNVVIKGCRLSWGGHYYQGTDGADRPYDRPDGFGIEPSDGPIEIAETVAEHNFGDGLDSKARNTYIHHCIVSNNTCDGIKLWGAPSKVENCLVYGTGDGAESPWVPIVIDQEGQPNGTFEITNVTVDDVPTRESYMVTVQYDSSTPTALILRNNIFANGYGAVFIGPSVKLTAEHNLFFRPNDREQVIIGEKEFTADDLRAGKLGPGNISQDPLFVRPAWGEEGDYHLRDGGPAIDAGTDRGAPNTDLDHKSRPQGGSCDIGCYER